MNIGEINGVEPQYYFDANALFKYYRDEKGSLNIKRLVSMQSNPILVSSLTSLGNRLQIYSRTTILCSKSLIVFSLTNRCPELSHPIDPST